MRGLTSRNAPSDSCDYQFEEIHVDGLDVYGWADIEFGHPSDWLIGAVKIDRVYDADGHELHHWKIGLTDLRAAIYDQCASSIQMTIEDELTARAEP